MNKLDMIAEANLILENEGLEAEKQRVLEELRLVESRVTHAKANIVCAEISLAKLRDTLEREETAAKQYKLTGDCAAYKKEVGIGDYSPPTQFQFGGWVEQPKFKLYTTTCTL